MARYRVHVFCDSCSQTHPMHITVNLDDGPVDEASIGDAYNGKKLSATVAALTKNQVQCPKTKKWFVQRDNRQIFLAPIAN